jgi:hypothetical protein
MHQSLVSMIGPSIKRFGLVAAASSVTSKRAEAFPWMIVIAAASMAANQMAANARGDGGVGAMLEANILLVQVAIGKLETLQKMVGEILLQLKQLPDEIDRSLKQENTRRLQVELYAVINGYFEELQSRQAFSSDKEWRTEPKRRRIEHLLDRLTEARQNLRVEGMIDPATALIVSSLPFVENSIRNILEFAPKDLKSTLETAYLPWLDSIVNPAAQGSAADYANSAAARLSQKMKAAAESVLGKRLGMMPGTALLSCSGVNDYAPSQFVNPHNCTGILGGNPGGAQRFIVLDPSSSTFASDLMAAFNASAHSVFPVPRDESSTSNLRNILGIEVGSADDVRLLQTSKTKDGSLLIAAVTCTYDTIPERFGPRERLLRRARLAESELLVDGKGSGVRVLGLAIENEQVENADASTPPDCDIVGANLPNGPKRLAFMQRMNSTEIGRREYERFAMMLEDINAERSRYALGLSAVINAETARQNVRELIGRYS